MTIGVAPNPSARSVAISRVRAATAEYIVRIAPKIAPRPIPAEDAAEHLHDLESASDCEA